jgi:cellobiose dehydrogenase (acceptor)
MGAANAIAQRCHSSAADRTGWCGLTHGGHMVSDLLLMAWPYKDQVMTSFRWATDYFPAGVFNEGNATLTQISSWVNTTGYEVIYRCQNCFSWGGGGGGQGGGASSAEVSPTSSGSLVLGHAQSFDSPANPGCPDKITYGFHDNGYGQWGAALNGSTSASYSKWAALATKSVATSCS